MHDTALREELLKHLELLPPELQRQVLELSKAMARSASRGVPGKQLLRFVGILSHEDAEAMAQLVEAGCEQVDSDDW